MVLIPFLSILGIIDDFVLVRKSLKTKKNKKIGLEALSRVRVRVRLRGCGHREDMILMLTLTTSPSPTLDKASKPIFLFFLF